MHEKAAAYFLIDHEMDRFKLKLNASYNDDDDDDQRDSDSGRVLRRKVKENKLNETLEYFVCR